MAKKNRDVVFEDDFIKVQGLGFDPSSHEARVLITEKQRGVGLYYITVMFSSGNSVQINYDGANSGRDKEPTATTKEPNDAVKEIRVVCARPSHNG